MVTLVPNPIAVAQNPTKGVELEMMKVLRRMLSGNGRPQILGEWIL